MPRAQHSSSDDDDNSSDASSANLSWPLPTYHRGFPCVRLPFNKSVFVKTVKAANKRSLSATFYFEGVDEERLLEIASSLFPFPGQPVRFSKGDPFNKVVVRSMTYFADSTQSHAFYLLLTTDGLPHAISKFLAVAGKLRAKELLPKADFDKDTKLHAYFARLLLFHSVTERDLDASELRMKAWIERRLGYQTDLWSFVPRSADTQERSPRRVDCYAATRKRAAAAARGEEEAFPRRKRAARGEEEAFSRPRRAAARPAEEEEERCPALSAIAVRPSSPLRAAAASAGWPSNGQLDLFGSSSPVGTPDSSSVSWIGNWSNPATPAAASRSQPQQDHAALSPVVLSQPGQTADAVAQWLQQNGGAPASERPDDIGAQAPRVGRMFDIPDIFLKFLRCNRVFTAEERGDLIEALCTHYQATKGFHHASALGELPLLQFLTTAARIEEELTGYIEQVFSLQLPRPMSPRGFELVRAICDIRYSDSEVCRQFLDPFHWVCTHWDEFHTLSFTGMLDRTSALFVFTVDAVNRCMEATLKGGHAVSKCVPLADIMGLVGKDLSRLAAWVDYLCQTSEMLTQLTQSSFPAESHSLCAVVNLVSPYRRAPTAFQWEHNRWLPKCAESADDVVRRVMHKVSTIRGELQTIDGVDIHQSCFAYKCFDHGLNLGEQLTTAVAIDPRGVLSLLHANHCSFPGNDRTEDDVQGFYAAIRSRLP